MTVEQFIELLEQYSSTPEEHHTLCNSNKPDGIFYTRDEQQQFIEYLTQITTLLKKSIDNDV